MYKHDRSSLITIAPNWKRAQCPSIGEWINKLLYIHPGEYFSVIKRHRLLIQKHGWSSQVLWEWKTPDIKSACWMIPFMWNSRTVKNSLCWKRYEECLPLGAGVCGDWLGRKKRKLGVLESSYLDRLQSAWVCTFIKTHWTIKLMNCTFEYMYTMLQYKIFLKIIKEIYIVFVYLSIMWIHFLILLRFTVVHLYVKF